MIRHHRVAPGVTHLELRRPGSQVVHVARIQRGSPNKLKIVLSNNLVSGPKPRTEATSRMCRRVRCLVAINGDYFTQTGLPVGGLISDGQPIRSPLSTRRQFSIAPDGALTIERQTMSTSLTTYHQLPPARRLLSRDDGLEPRVTTVDAINVLRRSDRIVMYTPRFAHTTEQRGGTEIIARIVDPSGPLRTGRDTTIELLSTRGGASRIPLDGVVLFGHGAGSSALAALWREVAAGRADRLATVRVDVTPGAMQSVDGKEMLVRDGEVVRTPRSARHPRTMIGWNRAGDILLATADGRQPGRASGMTFAESATLMRSLGARQAISLDGGGSTTFVMKGKVVNRPSNASGRERWVAVAVAVVRAS